MKFLNIAFVLACSLFVFSCKDDPVTPQIPNKPPTIPLVVSPLDKDSSISINTILEWKCSDPDNDLITYTLYLDTVSTPLNKVTDTITTQSYKVSGLKDSTFYYWKIVAKDRFGATSASPVFSFRTEEKISTLVAYFPFDGTTNDMSGNLTLDNIPTVTYTDGKNGTPNGALVLDGTSKSFLQYKSIAKIDLPAEFTICAWVHPNQLPSNYTQLAGRWINAGGALNATYSLTLRSSGILEGDTHNGTITTQTTANSPIPISEWSHVALIRNISGDLMIYVNGNLVGTKANSVPPQKSNVNFTVGKYGETMGSMFKGYIDNLRVYSRALETQELMNLLKDGN